MKILVIQLLSFDSIIQSISILTGLRKKHPKAEIHLVLYDRYKKSGSLVDTADAIWTVPTNRLWKKIVDANGFETTIDLLDDWIEDLREFDFDLILNLSFSNTAATYLTHLISRPNSVVRGYSRHSDGYLALTDETSKYHYGQSGKGKYNIRSKLDLMIDIAGLRDLFDEDQLGRRENSLSEKGTDEIRRIFSKDTARKKSIAFFPSTAANEQIYFSTFLNSLKANANIEVVELGHLIDSTEPAVLAIHEQISKSDWLVAYDTLVVRMADLLCKPVIYISKSQNDFFEHGPQTPGSIILRMDCETGFSAGNIFNLRANEHLNDQIIAVRPTADEWTIYQSPSIDFMWGSHLCQAVEFGWPYPEIVDPLQTKALNQIVQLSRLAQEQIKNLMSSTGDRAILSHLIDRIDESIDAVARVIPCLGPLIWNFQTTKVAIGPLPLEVLYQTFDDLYQGLEKHAVGILAQNTKGPFNEPRNIQSVA